MTSRTSSENGLLRKPRCLELLAPARDLECGMAAVRHGADAVYIGADRFGARAAAGNSVEDIKALCDYAHRFGARVYVTVNTIIYEGELEDTQKLITRLSHVGVDAILVQDMATLRMRQVAFDEVGYAPAVHASTQTDNRTAEKVRWLRSLGFTRVVLAREMSLEEIRDIHKAVPDVELEVFVHGALCVSFSGQCYASQHLFKRSANRGECAQMCRMKFDLVDANGDVIVKDRYLLSMKDLCQVDHLEELADAGAVSFKIEGRLKDADYVKNVVSAYSKRLDEIVNRRPGDYCRASWGRVERGFEPDLRRTFNRGYTDYFIGRKAADNAAVSSPHGRLVGKTGRDAKVSAAGLCTMFSPKALGEFVGTVGEVRYGKKGSLAVKAAHGGARLAKPTFANGDGLCFINENHELVGFRVNLAEGNRLWPFRMPQGLKPGMSLYRNNDVAFERTLKTETTRRYVPVGMRFAATANGFSLAMSFSANGTKHEAEACVDFAHQEARVPQAANIRQQLSRLGNTVYEAETITIDEGADRWFVPSSVLADLRRKAVNALEETLNSRENVAGGGSVPEKAQCWSSEYRRYPYLFNVSNSESRGFYDAHGIDVAQPAFEVAEPRESVVMQCRYCLRHELGHCVRRGGSKPTWKEPLTLRLGDGTEFRLDFRCDECQMNLHPVCH